MVCQKSKIVDKDPRMSSSSRLTLALGAKQGAAAWKQAG